MEDGSVQGDPGDLPYKDQLSDDDFALDPESPVTMEDIEDMPQLADGESYSIGSIHYYLGEFSPVCLTKSKVWYEYYEPWELGIFKDQGVESAWIKENIFDSIDEDTELYYASQNSYLANREFAKVQCSIQFSTPRFVAYLNMISGELTSVNILYDGEDYVFYSPPMLASDQNPSTLHKLSQSTDFDLTKETQFSIEIAKEIEDTFKLSTTFQIVPLPEWVKDTSASKPYSCYSFHFISIGV